MSGDEEASNHILFILLTILFTLLIIANAYFYQNVEFMGIVAKYLPNASSNILLGMIVGGILTAANLMDEEFSFDDEFFFLVMLPPIIFASGFKVRKDYLFYNFGTIIIYAFAGTAIATAVIALILYWLSHLAYQLTLNECLIYASLISAIDPVATIVTMHAAGVGGRLYALIFGEAVLNDAVAIVINGVFLDVAEAEEDKPILQELAIAIPKILLITVASILVGVIVSVAAAYMFKKSNLKQNHTLEVFLFFLLGIVPYMICESTHGWLSGIMAILFSGIFFDYYAYYHLSEEAQNAVKVIVHMLEFVFEGFIFFFLGAAVWRCKNWNFGLFLLTLIACIIGRAVAVFPLTWIINRYRKHKIGLNECIMMWFSGLRGPVSFALAFRISSKAVEEDEDVREAIITASLLVIWVTTFILGGSSNCMLDCLGLLGIKEEKNFIESQHWFRKLDKKYMKPFGCDSRDFKNRHDMTNFTVTRYFIPKKDTKLMEALEEQNIEEIPASESDHEEENCRELNEYEGATTRSEAL